MSRYKQKLPQPPGIPGLAGGEVRRGQGRCCAAVLDPRPTRTLTASIHTLADLSAAKHTQGAVFPTDRPKRAKLLKLVVFSQKRHDIKEENDYGRPQENP